MTTIFDDLRLAAFLERTFETYGIIVRNSHFVYASGKHGDTYVNKDAIYVHPELVNQVASIMALVIRNYEIKFSIIAGPALGGIPLAQMLAQKWLTLFGEIKMIAIVEKDEAGGYLLRRGYDQLVRNQRVLMVEDVLTTGKSVGQCIAALQKQQAEVVQIINIWQRGEDIDTHNIPYKPLMKKIFPMYDAQDCPLCAAGIPVNTSLGKGQQFLLEKQA